jgi:hypothetical protein
VSVSECGGHRFLAEADAPADHQGSHSRPAIPELMCTTVPAGEVERAPLEAPDGGARDHGHGGFSSGLGVARGFGNGLACAESLAGGPAQYQTMSRDRVSRRSSPTAG